VVIGIALIAVLLWRLDVGNIYHNIRHVRFIYLVYGLVPYLLFIIVSAWRWQVLLDYKRFQIPVMKTLGIYFIATFFNNFLPTTIGGDVMRVFYSMKRRKADALATVLVDRILGFVGLFIFALCAVLYLVMRKGQTEFLPLMIFGLVAIVIITYVFFSKNVYEKVSPFLDKIVFLRIGERLNKLHSSTTDFSGAWGTIIGCTVFSIIIQALLAIGPYVVMRGMGIDHVSIVPFFIYIPIINVVSIIPISFNALGVREYFYIVLFARVGVLGEQAVAISLVSFFLYFLLSLIGGVIFIFYRKH
jgi:uncharacterized protein (TIRG00374 family)